MSFRMLGNGSVYALLVAFAVTLGLGGTCESDQGRPNDGAKGRDGSKGDEQQQPDLEKHLYAKLQQGGWLGSRKFPYVFKAEQVHGRKLQGFQFLRRVGAGSSYDLLGRARQAELRVDRGSSHLLVRVLHCDILKQEGKKEKESAYFADREWSIDLPKDWRSLALTRQKPQLSAPEKTFLAKGPPMSETDQMLRLAFGDDCKELSTTLKIHLSSRGLILATNKFRLEPNGQIRVEPCSIAQFNKARGGADPSEVTTFRSSWARLKLDRPARTVSDWFNSKKIVAIELPDGLRLVLEKR
jgi:hypothetical protein